MNKKKIIIISSVVLLIIVAACLIIFLTKDKKNLNKSKSNFKEDESKVQIVDIESKTRPYAVMINNLNEARIVQSGLSQAYIVYEIIVEGGITRYLALFKDVNVERIGSVRSARHYYLDYVLENDAIYVHWGWSPQAQEDIGTLKINNLNGLTYEGTYFYRENPFKISSEHTGFTNTELIDKAVKKLGYETDTDKGLLLNYSAKSVDYSKYGEVNNADEITLTYSKYITDKYVYDKENKVYNRYVNAAENKDYNTGEILTVKNIIIYQINNYSIAGDAKGRQFLDNVGTGEGYYVSEGKVMKIYWAKDSRENKTIYTLENGKELIVNDGNTFIQIMPTSGSIDIQAKESVEDTNE